MCIHLTDCSHLCSSYLVGISEEEVPIEELYW